MAVLDKDTLDELETIVRHLQDNQKNLKGAVFYSLKDTCFLAGVDIGLIDSLNTQGDAAAKSEQGQALFDSIENLKIPTVSCVHGVCLGGGTELVLATDCILMSDDRATIIGLPEVKLGILPGLGGTYRMPKRVGLPTALSLILTGKTLKAKQAKRKGLADEIYPKENLLGMAPRHFNTKRSQTSLKSFLGSVVFENFFAKKIIFQKARENVLKKTQGHYQAPLKILELMESGMTRTKRSYLQKEAQAFGELSMGRQSENLRNIFFLTERAKKYSGPQTTKDPLPLKRGACLGGGVMGGGIVWLMAQNGMAPCLKDLSWKACEGGLAQSGRIFQDKAKRKQMSREAGEKKQRSIRPQLDYRGFKHVDLLIEAVAEDIEIKKSVLKDVEREVREETLITSNTSSLSLEEMALSLKHPERFGGLHFFNPVNRMPLVEIGTHSQMAPETLKALHAWAVKVKKTPIVVKDSPGLLINRILMPYINEGGFLLESGVYPKDLDTACVHFGMPMGPCRLLDEIGLDIGLNVARILHKGLGQRLTPSPLSEKMLKRGWRGKKSLRGFYDYDESGKSLGPNKNVLDLIPTKGKKMSEVEMQMRVIIPMINEAAYVLDERIVADAATVDLGLVFGTGFPPFRGGLLRYADSEGPRRIYDSLTQFCETVSTERYAPSPRLKDLARSKSRFYSS